MDWKKFDKKVITDKHGDMYKYRELYKGRHSDLFVRAKELIQNGEVIDYLQNGPETGTTVRTPYLVYNISKIICDVPALLISRSMGGVLTNHKGEVTQTPEGDEETMIEDDEGEAVDLQQALITQIVDNSKLKRMHKSNILQHQVDGGIVGVPIIKNGQVMIQFKERNVYFPHDDGMGADLVYELDAKDADQNDYVHVYTERQENGDLVTENRLYKRNKLGDLTEVTNDLEIFEVIGIAPKDLKRTFPGRQRLFIDYWGNEATFMDPLGVSALEGQEGKQEEVNWTLTRSAQTFERNGKPRISITTELWDRLEALAEERGGEGARIDHRDLELTEMDADGNSLKIHQIDIDKIGDIQYVKDIVSAMLAETHTAKSATEIFDERSGTASAQSGVAKFYDLFISLIKAESLRNEYVEFLENLFESALWLARRNNADIIVEKPYIEVKTMIPTPKREKDDNSVKKYEAKVQSLETTLREIHIDKTDEWIDAEVDRILTEQSQDDSYSMQRGRQNLQSFLGNRSATGAPLNDDGTPRAGDE